MPLYFKGLKTWELFVCHTYKTYLGILANELAMVAMVAKIHVSTLYVQYYTVQYTSLLIALSVSGFSFRRC